MKFPSKLYTVEESVIYQMTRLMELIPNEGIAINMLFREAKDKMVISDFIDALICMYATECIEFKDNKIFRSNYD